MRPAKILATVIASFFVGSTPLASSYAYSERPELAACQPRHAISLLGSASGIALVSSGRCSE